MKVVLRQDVPKLGEAGTVREVSNGYARNFLIPQGLAVVATPGEIKTAEHNLEVKGRKVARMEAQLQALADRINGQRLEFTARAGEQGRLYGSITAGDIAEKLSGIVGEEIDRRKVVLDDQLRTAGEHTVAVHLVGRLRPAITVVVTGVDEAGNPVTFEAAVEAVEEAVEEAVDSVLEEVAETEAEIEAETEAEIEAEAETEAEAEV
jgi:large subunit ribosomal protein L9